MKLKARVCKTLFSQARGLMFRKLENAEPLLFVHKNPTNNAIHSYFVQFPFLVAWFNKKNQLIDEKIIMPWKLYVKPRKKYYKLLEVPITAEFEGFLRR